jgi:protein involved in polysaccharide export with SLBB domain
MNVYFRKLVFLILISMVWMLAPGTFAQDDSTDSATPDDSSSDTPGMSTFDESEDASLFVGHYRINPGATVSIEIITNRINAYIAMVDDEGNIALPVIGPVAVFDLTSTEARQAIQDITDEYYNNAWVTFRILTLGRVKFYIYGDIDEPGFYTATGATTFLDLLQRFGLGSEADHRRIVHVRGERSTALPEPTDLIGEFEQPVNELIDDSLELFAENKIDELDPGVSIVDPLLFTREGQIETRNFYLEYGDVIFVPDPEITVDLTGFRRPGFYEVLPGETWSDLVTLAGGPEFDSNLANLILERRDINGELSELYYNLNVLRLDDLAAIPLCNFDSLKLLPYEKNVYVLGEVNEAGAYPYVPGKTPLEYLTDAGGPSDNAHLRFAALIRPPSDQFVPIEESEVIPVDLIETILHGTPSAAVAIEPGDILYVPDQGAGISISTIFTGLSVLVNAYRLFDN